MRKRLDRKVMHQREAKERQETYDSLTNEAKIMVLDDKFGSGKGAVKQRKQLS